MRQADEMTDWILTAQGVGPRAHAMERWRRTSTSAWLVAALMAVEAAGAEDGPNASSSSLDNAANRVAHSFHRHHVWSCTDPDPLSVK